jgi:hypothetical protein
MVFQPAEMISQFLLLEVYASNLKNVSGLFAFPPVTALQPHLHLILPSWAIPRKSVAQRSELAKSKGFEYYREDETRLLHRR